MKGTKHNYDDELYEDEDYYYNDEEYYNNEPLIEDTQKKPAATSKKQTSVNSSANAKKAKTKQSAVDNKQVKKSTAVDTNKTKANTLVSPAKADSPSIVMETVTLTSNDNQDNINPVNIPTPIKTDAGEAGKKSNLSIVIIGHVDSGKSTLMGHLLYLLGEVSEKMMQKYEKESKRIGKSTFHFAWAMDEDTEERKRGITVDIAYKRFETGSKIVTVMDAPGHRDFIPNMITGTAAADTAVLVIDSAKNAFDAGFFSGGQTKEHAILAKSLGVKQMIVCVNKLEMWDWSKERFDYIETHVRSYLVNIEFKEENIFFMPVSGLNGTNLITVDKDIPKLSWYEGPSLIELIDKIESPARDLDAPVRFVISDVGLTTINSLQGIGIYGKLATGVITDNMEYLIMPSNLKTKIRAMTVDNSKSSTLLAGQSGDILLTLDKTLSEDIYPGNVLCCIDNPVPVVSTFKAHIITLDLKAPLSIGQVIFLHIQSQKTQAKIKKIVKIFSKNQITSKANTIFIPKNFNAIVNLECEEKICLELHSNIKQLGRITLRGEGTTLAVGVVMEFL